MFQTQAGERVSHRATEHTSEHRGTSDGHAPFTGFDDTEAVATDAAGDGGKKMRLSEWSCGSVPGADPDIGPSSFHAYCCATKSTGAPSPSSRIDFRLLIDAANSETPTVTVRVRVRVRVRV
jgi:hypothetical protein